MITLKSFKKLKVVSKSYISFNHDVQNLYWNRKKCKSIILPKQKSFYNQVLLIYKSV